MADICITRNKKGGDRENVLEVWSAKSFPYLKIMKGRLDWVSTNSDEVIYHGSMRKEVYAAMGGVTPPKGTKTISGIGVIKQHLHQRRN